MEADKKFNLDHRLSVICRVVINYVFVPLCRSNSPTNVAVKNQIKQELQLEKENDFSPEQIDSMLVNRVKYLFLHIFTFSWNSSIF